MIYECSMTQVLWLKSILMPSVIPKSKTIAWEKWTLFVFCRVYSNYNYFLTSAMVCPAGLGLGPWVYNLRGASKLSHQDKYHFNAVFLK